MWQAIHTSAKSAGNSDRCRFIQTQVFGKQTKNGLCAVELSAFFFD